LKFLVDNAVSPLVAEALRAAGHNAVHVRDYGIQTAPDRQILARAADEGRKRPQQQAALLLLNLPNLAARLEQGSVVVFDRNRIRVRPLPIRG